MLIFSCHFLVHMFVCIRTGQKWQRNSSRRCLTTLNLFCCPESKHGLEVRRPQIQNQVKCFNCRFRAKTTGLTLITPVCFWWHQLCATSVSYWARTDTPAASLKQRRGSCLMRSLLRIVKSWLTCCWTWRTDPSWRAETRMKTGSKVLSAVGTFWKFALQLNELHSFTWFFWI